MQILKNVICNLVLQIDVLQMNLDYDGNFIGETGTWGPFY